MNYKIKTKYNQITFEERSNISFLLNEEKLSIRSIAKKLDKATSTISREIKRNCTHGIYEAAKANKKAMKRFTSRNIKPAEKYKEFTNLFQKYFNKKWHGIMTTYHKIVNEYPNIKAPTWRQLYYIVNSNKWVIKRKDLLRKRYKTGGKRSGGYFSKFGTKYVFPYWVRPKHINDRSEFGHWEIDLVVGKNRHGHRHLMTLTERKTRFNIIVPIKSKNPKSLNKTLRETISQYGLLVKSITSDNGLEFKALGLFGYFTGIDIYKCDPYASHERGTNENANGLIRREYPKKTDFNLVSDEELEILMDNINNMPRPMFDYNSAIDRYKEEMKDINIKAEWQKLLDRAEDKKRRKTSRIQGFKYLRNFNA